MTTEQVFSEFCDRNPGFQSTVLHDSELAAGAHLTRKALEAVEGALAAEGLDYDVRHRVATRLIDTFLPSDSARAQLDRISRHEHSSRAFS
ncbi:hypothetical protein [Streptomyces sp. NPDC000351]|uniref:hypothetical protein n=1 Tax=Streptomyces sp. NPDC000351 TaxID=3154250 RepID=UPI0033186C18